MYRLLDGEPADNADVVEAWWISRICEEFSCVPTVALREIDNAPVGLLEQVIEYRALARAKAMYERADTPALVARLPDDPMVGIVREIDFAMAQEALTARRNG